mmetsp:Transcript_63146/g.100377  ORF Transcript_63146/g.100377 Transcript_63146/m.100377 type:complete len:102 (-) Transcript_63146:623-928(-)
MLIDAGQQNNDNQQRDKRLTDKPSTMIEATRYHQYLSKHEHVDDLQSGIRPQETSMIIIVIFEENAHAEHANHEPHFEPEIHLLVEHKVSNILDLRPPRIR